MNIVVRRSTSEDARSNPLSSLSPRQFLLLAIDTCCCLLMWFLFSSSFFWRWTLEDEHWKMNIRWWKTFKEDEYQKRWWWTSEEDEYPKKMMSNIGRRWILEAMIQCPSAGEQHINPFPRWCSLVNGGISNPNTADRDGKIKDDNNHDDDNNHQAKAISSLIKTPTLLSDTVKVHFYHFH